MKRKTNVKELRKEMAEKGITTIMELSVETGVSRATLGKILRGEIQPSSDVMYKLAEGLNLSPERAGKIFFAENLLTA